MKEGKNTKCKKRSVGISNIGSNIAPAPASPANSNIMSSNLPLLFANGHPRSLETISQVELEEFVPFMILCSLGEDLSKKPKSLKNCPVPEWWPEGFPFKFPHVGKSELTDRQVMLKSLVCRCYTFYGCEFLLKFSSELAELPQSHLIYHENKEEKTTSILDGSGKMLVKCRNENIYYDIHKNPRRYLSPSHHTSISQVKKNGPVVDLTFDTSSEDEKEVNFKKSSVQLDKSKKRKRNHEPSERILKRRRGCFKDLFEDNPPPTEVSKEMFMRKHDLLPKETIIEDNIISNEDRKRKWSSLFSVLSISSERGQRLLNRKKHTFNVEESLERISRYCSPEDILEEENPKQICTRASSVFPAIHKDELNTDKKLQENKEVWFHQYKWPHRTRNPVYPHLGVSLKPCSVVIIPLSPETLEYYLHHRQSTGTMTPVNWWDSETPMCPCQKIPVITLDEEDSAGPYCDKSISTQCSCPHKRQNRQASQTRNVHQETTNIDYRRSHFLSSTNRSTVKTQPRTVSESTGLRNAGRLVSNYVTSQHILDKSGLGVLLHNSLHDSESLKLKRSVYRRPLSVVAPPLLSRGTLNVHLLHCPTSCKPPSVKLSYGRSILDAIKWYSKDDCFTVPGHKAIKKDTMLMNCLLQENIKPIGEVTSSDVKDFFEKNKTNPDKDYCFERSSECVTKRVTRRGERHYSGREPCPLCFQGNDELCVYEFIRQAKLAGINLGKNQRLLQTMFNKIIKSLNENS